MLYATDILQKQLYLLKAKKVVSKTTYDRMKLLSRNLHIMFSQILN